MTPARLTVFGLAFLAAAAFCAKARAAGDERAQHVVFAGSYDNDHSYPDTSGLCTVSLAGASVTVNSNGASFSGDAWLYPGEVYTLYYTAQDMSDIVGRLTAPAGYQLLINNQPYTTFTATGPGSNPPGNTSSGYWYVELRQVDGGGAPGASPGLFVGGRQATGVIWQASTGVLSNGSPAGNILLRGVLPSSGFFSRGVLSYMAPSIDAEALSDPTGLRQVRTPQTLVDIHDITNGFQLDFYPVSAITGTSGGYYTFTGLPFVSYEITSGGNASEVQVTRASGSFSLITTATFNSSNQSWQVGSGGLQTIQKTNTTDGSGDRVETTLVQDGSGTTSSKTARTYHDYPWGSELIQEVDDPDSKAFTTTYEYYDASSDLEDVTYPGGNWVKFDYTPQEQVFHEYHPWLGGDSVTPATATQSNCHVITYTYANDWNGQATLVASRTETINGTTVAQMATTHDLSQSANSRSLWVQTRQDSSASGQSLTSTIKAYQPLQNSPANSPYEGLPYSVQHSDGTMESYVQVLGTYDASAHTFSANTGGLDLETITLHGLTPAVGGSVNGAVQDSSFAGQTIDPISLAPNQSTETIAYRQNGLLMREETYVFAGGGFSLVAWTNYAYTSSGKLSGTSASNGAATSATYANEFKTAQTNASGTETDYTNDALQRVATMTKTAGPGYSGGGVPTDGITTTYTYDGDSHVVQAQTSGGGLTLTASSTYNQAGQLTSQTAGGYTTNYDVRVVSGGGLVQTTTLPGGATTVVTSYEDGQVEQITGTAQVGVYYTYVANGTGLLVKQYSGSTGSGNWTSTQSDWLGRKTLMAVPDPSGNSTEVDTLYSYNSLGQLSETSTPTPGIAPTLYAYDVLGALERTVLDVNGNGQIDLGGPDRISQQDTSYAADGSGNWWLQTVRRVYVDGSASPVTTGTKAVRLSGFAGGVEAETKAIDADGNVTDQQTLVNAASQLVTTTTSTTGINNKATQFAYNGLVVADTDLNGVTRTYGYDGLDRPVKTTDPRTGDINTTYESTSSQVLKTAYGDGTLIKQFTYESDGRVAAVTDANNDVVNYSYNWMGQVLTVSGSGAIPVTYTYDNNFGRLATETTTGQAGTGTTTFGYDGDLPLLATRTDAQGNKVANTYDSFGRIVIRTDARNIKTTYAYDPETGDLLSRTYSDGTPAITYAYNRTGALASVADAAGTRTFAYNTSTDLSLKNETLPALYNESGGAARVLSYAYDTGNVVGRLTGVNLGDAGNASADQATSYAYDNAATGRLASVTAGGAGQTSYAFNYAYTTNSDLLVASVANTTSGYTQNYTYEPTRNWVQETKAIYGTTTQAQFDYTYTNLGQRLTATQSGAAFAAYGSNPVVYTYGYDSVGQLSSASGAIASTPMSGRQYVYGYDSAGNRISANHTAVSDFAEGYTLNTLNQISEKKNTTVAVQGSANATGVLVTANGVGANAGQAGGYWGTDVAFNNVGGPAMGPVSVIAALAGGGSNGTDLVTSLTKSNVFIPAHSETMGYDQDGNLTSDGTWDYAWNAENELVTMTNLPAQAAGVAAETIQFSYDYLGRRISKTVNGTVRRYVYNGWNVMAELDASGNVLRHFIWGLDLSGTMSGAGGVGGLLMIQDSGSTYLPGYDANGNVVTLTNASSGSLAATYEYSPFGELLQAFGSYAALNPFRFSTKWWDAETGYAYYGARYYSPRLGRFLNQDPIQEKGGINLYGFCGNDGINRFDPLGNSWLSKLWDHTVLSASQHIGQYVSSLQRWANAHPLVFLDGFSYLTDSHLVWHEAQREPQIAAVVAAIATWYIGGWGAAAIYPAITATETTVVAGALAGAAGGFVGARASGADLSTSFRAAYQGGAWGGALAFAGSEFFKINPSSQFSWKSAASQFEGAEARYEVGRFAQNKLGMSGLEFDAILTAASFVGNEIVGDRIKTGVDSSGNSFKWISGILSRNLNSAMSFFDTHPVLDKIFGLPFDAADVVLGYQGLPTATGWEIINSDTLRAQVLSSHSLGALDMKTQSLLGVLSNGSMFSLPFGNIAPEGMNLTIGSNDPVNGFGLGLLLNPDASVQNLKSQFLGMAHTNYSGTGF